MPQIDRHKDRTVNIEFVAAEDLECLPYPERLTLIFVTSGSINGILNERPIAVSAPAVLCLSEEDTIQILKKHNVSAQSFSYHPDVLNSVPISETEDYFPIHPKIQTGLSLFQNNPTRTGVPFVTEKAFPQFKMYPIRWT
ncbi:AraC family transcriptional regulator, partial [Paenibacillus xylanivorans]